MAEGSPGKNALIQMNGRDLTNDKSTLVQVMAWGRQATSHYLVLCWLRSLTQYGLTRPQWFKTNTLTKSYRINETGESYWAFSPGDVPWCWSDLASPDCCWPAYDCNVHSIGRMPWRDPPPPLVLSSHTSWPGSGLGEGGENRKSMVCTMVNGIIVAWGIFTDMNQL